MNEYYSFAFPINCAILTVSSKRRRSRCRVLQKILSQAIGAKNQEKTQSLIATSFLISILLSISIIAVLEAGLKPLLLLLRTPAGTFSMAYEYLSIYLLGYLSVYLYCYFTAVLRSFGNAMFQMIAMLLCTVLNALLDPLFIHFFGFGGAAAATLLSQTICLLIMLLYLFRKKLFHMRLTAFRSSYIRPIILKGIPSAFQQSIPAFSTSFLTSLVNGYGITALAAYGIAGKLETLLFYPAMALNMVLTTIGGQCIGGKRRDRARDYIRLSLLCGGLLLCILTILIVLFSPQLSALFLHSPSAARIVSQYFKIVAVGYVLNTFTNCFLGSLNGMGSPLKSMLCMILYYMLIRMPLAWLLSAVGLGLNGIWSAVLISHIIAAAAAALITTHHFRRLSF